MLFRLGAVVVKGDVPLHIQYGLRVMSYGHNPAEPAGYELGGPQQYAAGGLQNTGDDWTFDDLPAVDDWYVDPWPAWDEPAGADEQLDDEGEPEYRNHYSSSSLLSPSPPPPPPHEQSRERQSHDQPTTSAGSMGTSNSHMPGVNEQQQQRNPAEAVGTRAGRHSTFAYHPNNIFHTLSDTSSPPTSELSYHAVPLSDDEEEQQQQQQQQSPAAMAPATRRRTQPRSRVVDLTDSPQQEAGSRAPAAPSRPLKRPAPADAEATHRTKRPTTAASPPEELDLTADHDTDAFLQHQQASTIAAQQGAAAAADDSANGPIKIGQRTCIICMEHYTNAAVTPCGHIYCHECLTQALKAGEKNSERAVGNCPMCRKPVSRKKNQVLPVAFMKRSAFRGKKKAGV
ncbi:hypothetical protein EJ03DRAFT_336534 [Teratosphaeria nubilosa]|uniref:RING-type domain-containing protein n=1 Tax=Teratosphaeria nubilosa TaxID=161662 RepID=A0A6G1L8P9_9PEZI|nr:hypothetical protein EJ03DRAFT_336534 [Teratosphaeria nubilosa]